MKGRSPNFTQVPLDVVGSTKFGRYPKISLEQTFNMIISDGFLVDYAGHQMVTQIINDAEGRGLYSSVRYQHMIAVISNTVYAIDSNLTAQSVGTINTFNGDVYIDENDVNQIAICDGHDIWIYNYIAGTFGKALTGSSPLDFVPGYISFQNGRFISAAFNSDNTWSWRLSDIGNGLSWPNDTFHVGLLQTKPDKIVAAQRFPGRGNLLYVMGATVTEPWQDIGANLFPYLKNSSLNIDYGCLNAATIAYNENIIVWLAANEKSGPVIAYSSGGDINRISTDGIDFKFTQLKNPANAYGFLFRQDGHLIYQITFPDDNLTYIYDFNTKLFFTLCDQNMNAHIAKRVAFFNNQYYFVSFIDGNLYQMSTQFTTYDGAEIPRIRICKPLRLPDASRFAVNNLTFTLEQGTQVNTYLGDDLLTEAGDPLLTESGEVLETDVGITIFVDAPLMAETGDDLLTEDDQDIIATTIEDIPYAVPQVVNLTVSKNGGQSFGTIWTKQLNPPGDFKNRLIYWQLGAANDFTAQFRFYGLGRFVVTDGVVSIYQ